MDNLDVGRRFTGEVTRSVIGKEVQGTLGFATGEYKAMVQNLTKDEKLKDKLNRFLAHYVSPTAYSDFPIFNDKRMADWQAQQVDESQKWLVIPGSEDPSHPGRMIDLDTGNLVPTTATYGPGDVYCILSHSWKGWEVSYDFFRRAQRNLEGSSPDGGDVGRVSQMSEDEAIRAVKKLNKLLEAKGDLKCDGQLVNVQLVLEMHLKTQGSERERAKALRSNTKAQERLTSAQSKANHYEKMYGRGNGDKANTKEGAVTFTVQEVQKNIANLREKAAKEAFNANRKMHDAQTEWEGCGEAREFFNIHRDIKMAVEELLSTLYTRKSARKLRQSLKQANNIYNSGHFPSTDRRYIWLDNCCIDKSNAGELNESLARMGDWYANADFCIVHVDDAPCDEEWVEEYKGLVNQYDALSSTVGGPFQLSPKENTAIDSWSDLIKSDPVYWAKRGWTLQELVLSRMTFYFNADWKELDREIVNTIGPVYHRVPFIKQYLSHHLVQYEKAENDQGETFQAAEECMEDIKSWTWPQQMDYRTASAQIGKMVYLRAKQVVEDKKKNQTSTRDEEQEVQGQIMKAEENEVANEVRQINSKLARVVSSTEPRIVNDCKEVQKIGGINKLDAWRPGTQDVNASARSIMTLASQREVTVPIDQVYSLMGILGVRFPVFYAEGLPKALCRLIDEVVIASNDVSVFNWSGRYSGNSIRGRSLYPSNIEAYMEPLDVPHLEEQARIHQGIVRLLQNKPLVQSRRAHKVIECLIQLTVKVNDLESHYPIHETLQLLAKAISKADFTSLSSHRHALKAIVIETGQTAKQQKAFDKQEKQSEKEDPRTKAGFRLDSFPGISPMLKSAQEKVEEVEIPPKPERTKSAFSLKSPIEIPSPALSIPSTRFGFGKKAKTETKPSNQLPGAVKIIEQEGKDFQKNNKNDQDLIKPKEKSAPDWDRLREHIIQFIDDINQPTTAEESTPNKASKHKDGNKTPAVMAKQPKVDPEINQRMVCPNPIIVSSAGIRGIFDIQRVVVQMNDRDILRAKVGNAVAGQMIEGSCTISTGFSSVYLEFTCEKKMLEDQLNVTDVINNYLVPNKENKNQQPEPSDEKEPETPSKIDPYKITPGKQRVKRILDLVQQDDLHAVAGEWVLARFSDVDGASWFLCQLSLGSNNDFQGRRIATDAFSFYDGIPELGLIEHWNTYMAEYKQYMCAFLDCFSKSKMNFESALQDLTELLKTVNGEASGEGKEQGTEGNEEAEEEEEASFMQNLIKAGSHITAGAISYTLRHHLQTRMEQSAIRSVPTKLRPAIRNMSKKMHLSPMMYHASREIHMF
ncbi:hypothetical protein ASPZODRAFT_1667941 [Penicilliopsis zonata CBS 506.65]|uniref:Heterokaryon incompatibility domain-containing protein n=1 Tax=Penicilliopsis zonata CBS 506.65 TaxID=1073090 RepID=A0A1L9S4K3_9EURO|nr:hypothetical protein ASPZODRAFT_1667941 [Penicilliopsis zonata CBS 506.65]OJJ42097.1 hypothetical protein ASPZODRAFT_1667941 [Penicilliopsis zonata CBS 506.65]